MKRIALAVTLVAFAAPGFAADEQAAAPGGDPMAGWVPRKVAREKADVQEILALCKSMQAAERKGDLEAAVALVDFPVLMVTDDAKGEAVASAWDREKWLKVMAPFYKNPQPGMHVTHRPIIFTVTDSLATVGDQWTMTMGGQGGATGLKKATARSSMIVIRKGGQWRVKSMMEGGWGDSMKEMPAAASQGTAPSGTGGGSAPVEGTPGPSTR
jgi:hypothetical protein